MNSRASNPSSCQRVKSLPLSARLRLLALLWSLLACALRTATWCAPAERSEPEVTIPRCRQAPVLDGRLSPGEWQYAATLTMFEAYPNALPQVVREEQPVFYLCWDSQYLYVALDSIDSNTSTIVAACSEHDNLRIIGDDCLEMMLAPGSGEQVNRYDFCTYYLAANALGTLWDCKFVALLNEAHNSWESGADLANSVDGTRWVCEMRVPLASISLQPPADGTVWRPNLDRTYLGYFWNAWNASGALNDACAAGASSCTGPTANTFRPLPAPPAESSSMWSATSRRARACRLAPPTCPTGGPTRPTGSVYPSSPTPSPSPARRTGSSGFRTTRSPAAASTRARRST